VRRLVLVPVLLAALALPAAALAKHTVYFTAAGPFGVAQVWSVDAAGGKAELLRRRMPVGPEGGVAALSSSGKKVFCICRKDEVDSIETDGGGLRRTGPLPRALRYSVVTLGPDGSAHWIRRFTTVYSLAPGARKPRVFRAVRNPESVVDERIVPSPDGRRIAYVAYGCLGPTCPDDGIETLLTAKVGGSDRTVVYQSTGEGKEIGEVAWSSDGSRLIFVDGTGEGDPKGELPVFFPPRYLVAPADGSNPAGTSIALPEAAFNPFFSPTGDQLAFTVFNKSRFELQTAATGSAEASPLTKLGCRYPNCEFAPRVFGWR
jgi:Tol biopolymer transport system component